MRPQCLICGRFVSSVIATVNGLDEISTVTGVCKLHGRVDVTASGWAYEDFFPEGFEEEG